MDFNILRPSPVAKDSSEESKIVEIEGDLFDAPDGAVLIHSCNCLGSWGAGIAKGFMQRYPHAFKIYRAHCSSMSTQTKYNSFPVDYLGDKRSKRSRLVRSPVGTALIIPPQPKDYAPQRPKSIKRANGEIENAESELEVTKKKKKHWIVCLFVSRNFGRNVSPPHIIVENTRYAIASMNAQLQSLNQVPDVEDRPGQLWACRFNSGLFSVPWKQTRKVLDDAGIEMTIVRPFGEEE